MALYTGAMGTALASAGFVQFNAVELLLPGAVTIRLLDGSAAPVTFSSKTFTSRDATYGTLLGIEKMVDGEGVEAPSLSLTLDAPSAAAASTLCQAANQGSAVTWWWGVIDPATGQPHGTPDTMFIGELDVPTFNAGLNSRLVEIDCTGAFDRFFDIEEGITLSNATHASYWAGEEGMEFVTGIETQLPWGQDITRPTFTGSDGSPGFRSNGGGIFGRILDQLGITAQS